MSLARKVAVNASALVGGRMISAALGLVSIGISTRYLGVDAFGALAAALAFSSLLNMVTDAGIWTIVSREIAKRPEETRHIFGTALTLGFVLSMLAAGVGVLFAFLLYGGADDALTRQGILLLLVTIPLSAPVGAVSAYFIAEQRAWVGTLGSVASSIVQLVFLVVAAVADLGFAGVAGAYVVAAIVQGALMLAVGAGRVTLRPAWDSAMARRLLGWAIPLSGARIVHSLYWRIDVVLLSLIASKREVGLYGLTYRVVDALVVLAPFVMVTLLPEFARLVDDRVRLQQIAQKAFTVMQIGAVGLLAIFAGFAGEIVDLAGGPEFDSAAPVLQVLMLGVALTYLGNVFAQVSVAANQQALLFRMTLILLPVNVALNLALIPLWGALGAAIAFAISEVLHLALLAVVYRSYTELPRPYRALRVLAAAGLVGLIASAKLLPGVSGLSSIVTLAAGLPLAVAAYVGALYALGAMPAEIHSNLVEPALSRLRRHRVAS